MSIELASDTSSHLSQKPDVLPEPLTFLRPPSSLAPPGQPVLVPRGSSMVFEGMGNVGISDMADLNSGDRCCDRKRGQEYQDCRCILSHRRLR